MPPKVSTVAATAARTWSSSRMSHFSARPWPPAALTASTALWMVPGSFGLGTVGLRRDRHVGAVARRAQGDRQADAARGAGDEQGLAG